MAEAFARAYGSDILVVQSAGLAPASIVQALTRQVLMEKNISSESQFPKSLESVAGDSFDVVVNISGEPLPSELRTRRSIEWRVRDPIGQSESLYRTVAAEIEEGVLDARALQKLQECVDTSIAALRRLTEDARGAGARVSVFSSILTGRYGPK